jgi:hypothetical protein
MDELKKRFGKIRQIHLDKKKQISTLTEGNINAEDKKNWQI